MRNEGGFMSVSTIVFLIGIVMCIGAILIYLRAEDTPFHKTLSKINEVSAQLKTLEGKVDANTGAITKQNEKIATAEWELGQMKAVNTETAKECEAAQDHCSRLREGQIRIQEEISKKRPITTIQPFTGPIEIEILTPTRRYKATGKTTKKKTTNTTPSTTKKKTRKKAPTRKKTTKSRSSSSVVPNTPAPRMDARSKPLGRGVSALMS